MTLDKWTEEARERGVDAARCVATWCVDGNTKQEAIRYVVTMMDEGEDVSDYLPRYPDLSGEYADDPTPLSLAREITGDEDVEPDVINAIADAFEAGVSDTFSEACEAAFRNAVSEEN